MNIILIGGGQEYHGPTAERDKRVVQETAKHLFNLVGNSVEIVTGGMPGIPMDFIDTWMEVGGKNVKFVVSDEYMSTVKDIVMNVEYNGGFRTQAERREALVKLEGLKAAFFVQGGQYTTDEIIKCHKRDPKIKTICFVGSGGASGGQIPYKGELFDTSGYPEWMHNSDPSSDPQELGKKFAQEISLSIK